MANRKAPAFNVSQMTRLSLKAELQADLKDTNEYSSVFIYPLNIGIFYILLKW